MEAVRKPYLPAAGHHWLLPLYDPFVKLLGSEIAMRALVDKASIQPGQRVLDIGCGTGTLPIMIKRLYRDVDVIGLDPDPHALARAKRKAKRASVAVQFHQGFADALPYPDASVDRVLSSFMFHHLGSDEKHRMLREVRRVLRSGGVLILLDFGGPDSARDCLLARLIHSSRHLKDNSEEQILALMNQSGLTDTKKVAQGTMLFGRLLTKYYQGSVPQAAQQASSG